MPFQSQVFLDRFAPDGTQRTVDIRLLAMTDGYRAFGAKWLGSRMHAIAHEDLGGGGQFATSLIQQPESVETIASTVRSDSTLLTFTVDPQGMAKTMHVCDGRPDLFLIYTNPSPDQLYRVRFSEDGTPNLETVASLGAGFTQPVWAPGWFDRDLAMVEIADSTNNQASISRWYDSTVDEVATIHNRTPYGGAIKARGMAWTGRDYLVVAEDTTAIPPASYQILYFRPSWNQNVAVSISTKSTFAAGALEQVVDIDWDGHDILVYTVVRVDIGA